MNESVFSLVFSAFLRFLLMNLKSYTFRIHSSIILKDFHRRLCAKTIEMLDFILCFRQKLRDLERAFHGSESVSARS